MFFFIETRKNTFFFIKIMNGIKKVLFLENFFSKINSIKLCRKINFYCFINFCTLGPLLETTRTK